MANTTHDHQIQVGSTTTSLKLATDTSGTALYSVSEDTPSYNQILEIEQKNWIGGHGQHELTNPNMYFSGQSIDTTQEGRILLGPKISEVYQTPVQQEKYWAGVDVMKGINGLEWYAQTFTPAATHTIGTVTLNLYRSGNPGTVYVGIRATSAGKPTGADLCLATLPQESIQLYAPYASATFAFSSPVSLTSGTVYAIVVRAPAGNGTNYVGWAGDQSAPAYAGGSLITGIDYGTFEVWTIDTATDMYFDEWGVASTALASTPTCFLWSATASKWICADSSKIYIYSNGAWTAATTTIAGVVDLKEYNGKIYAACGSGDNFWYSADGDTWTECTLTDHHGIKFLSAPNTDGTANTNWKLMTPNELTYSANPINAGTEFSSPAYIGDTSSNVINVFLCGDELAIGRTDNLYHYDSNGGLHAKMNELQNQRSTENFKYIQNWQGATYFSLANGIGEIVGNLSSGVYNKISPLLDTGDIDKVGICRGMTADTDYMYFAMLEGNITIIYKSKPNSDGSWSHCPLVYLGTNQCDTIAIAQHSTTDRRLWFGYGTHTGYVQITDNPTTDDNARFASSGNIIMSYLYGTNPYWDKMVQSIVTETKGCAAGITVTPKYFKDTDTSASSLTSAITTNGVVKTDLTTALSGKRFKFELDLATNDSTKTPEVHRLTIRGHEKPETHRIHNCTYLVGEDKSHRTKTVRTTLRGLRTTTTLVKFADCRYGEEVTKTGAVAGTDYHYCVMLPGYPRETEVIQSKGNDTELAIECRFMEV
jgi:hypothetical protein